MSRQSPTEVLIPDERIDEPIPYRPSVPCPQCGTAVVTIEQRVYSPDDGIKVRCSVRADGVICCSHLPPGQAIEAARGLALALPAAQPDWFDLYLSKDKQARKQAPLARGLIGYFPNACLQVAHVSFVANEQHNPGLPLQWAFNKSSDEPDCEIRHMIDANAGPFDDDGLLHLAKKAWRALADLERYVLAAYPTARAGASVTGFERGSK